MEIVGVLVQKDRPISQALLHRIFIISDGILMDPMFSQRKILNKIGQLMKKEEKRGKGGRVTFRFIFKYDLFIV